MIQKATIQSLSDDMSQLDFPVQGAQYTEQGGILECGGIPGGGDTFGKSIHYMFRILTVIFFLIGELSCIITQSSI